MSWSGCRRGPRPGAMTGARRCPKPTTDTDTDAGRCRGPEPKPDSPTDGRGKRRRTAFHRMRIQGGNAKDDRAPAVRRDRALAASATRGLTRAHSLDRPPTPRPTSVDPRLGRVLARPRRAVRSCSHSLSAPPRGARKSGSTRPRIAPARCENPAEKSAISKREQGARIAVADASAAQPDSAARRRAKTPARTRSTRHGAGTRARSRPRRRAIRAIGVKTEPGRRTPTTPPPRAAPPRRATFAWAISLVPNQPPGASATAFRHRPRAFARAASASSTAVGVNAFPTDARIARRGRRARRRPRG